jgi:hypothetical protein
MSVSVSIEIFLGMFYRPQCLSEHRNVSECTWPYWGLLVAMTTFMADLSAIFRK